MLDLRYSLSHDEGLGNGIRLRQECSAPRFTPTQLLANFLYTACAICYNASSGMGLALQILVAAFHFAFDQNTEEDLFYDT